MKFRWKKVIICLAVVFSVLLLLILVWLLQRESYHQRSAAQKLTELKERAAPIEEEIRRLREELKDEEKAVSKENIDVYKRQGWS